MAYARKVGRVGWDSETYGHNVKTSSPAYRAQIDCWSLAVPTPVLHPRGYHEARGCVLPREALDDPGLRALLEDPSVTKIAHNARHDLHSAANAGVAVRGVVDTLETARLVWPGREGPGGGYGLKALRALLGKPVRDGFKDLTAPMPVPVPLKRGGFRKHPRMEPCPIESIVPGHARWEAKLAYAAEDAVDAMELHELAGLRLVELDRTLPGLPW